MDRISDRRHNTATKILFVLALAAATPCWAQSAVPAAAGRRERIALVSLVDRKLAVIENGVVVATFQVSVGAKVSPSPAGEFTIVSRVADPTYYHGETVIPAGKDNPVGTRWLGLNIKGYGIHGTNAPRSIGRASSHGCIRLRNRDMERLFTILRVGDAVQIRAERDEQIAWIFGGETEREDLASARSVTQTNGSQEEAQGAVGLGN